MHRPQHQQHQAYHQQQHPQQHRTACPVVASLVTLGALVLAGALFGVDAVRAPTVHAAPSRQTRSVSASLETFGVPHEMSKTILSETSIDGPAMWTLGPAGPSAAGIFLGWTGTDAAHHLNVRLGSGGLVFPSKVTLPETSPFAPAVTLEPSEGAVTNFEIAWTGTDRAHSLNVEFVSVSGGSITAGGKMTLHETSIAGPAIVFNGTLLLAWTGTDANHPLNVLPLAGNLRGQKTVLSQFSSDAGPSLSLIGANEFVLGWSVRGTQGLSLATSTDGVHFASALGSGMPRTSATAPQFVEPGEHSSSDGCIGWTGTDAAHHLNAQCTTQFPQFPDPAHTKTVLSETALGAPGFTGNEIAWTGTDLAHHLDVAQLQGL